MTRLNQAKRDPEIRTPRIVLPQIIQTPTQSREMRTNMTEIKAVLIN